MDEVGKGKKAESGDGSDDFFRGVGEVGGGWRVVTAGKRVKCYRGANPGAWQKGLCP